MKTFDQAYARLDQLIRETPLPTLEAEQKWVAEEFVRTGCLISGKPIPTFLKPCLIDRHQFEKIKRVTEVVMNCLEKVSSLYYTEPALRPLFELLPGEDKLTDVKPGYKRLIQHARLDAFLIGRDDIQFCEFNCDTPGGPGYMDYLTDIIAETTPMKRFRAEFKIVKDRLMQGVLDALLDCYAEWKGRRVEKPAFCITTVFDLDPTLSEIRQMADWFTAQGFDCTLADAKECAFEGGVFTARGRKVDLMYRRGAGYWWLDRPEDYKGIKAAYEAGAICMVNPISSKLGGKKSLMAVLQDPIMDKRLTEEEREIAHKNIPWTRLMRDGKTDYRGRQVDTIAFVRDHRETMVLKPIGLYGGKDVTIGHTVDQKTWERTIETAVRETYVVQEKIDIPELPLPVVKDGRLEMSPKKVNMNFFAFNGKYGGGLARVSDSWIINVSAGGGLLPFIVVE